MEEVLILRDPETSLLPEDLLSVNDSTLPQEDTTTALALHQEDLCRLIGTATDQGRALHREETTGDPITPMTAGADHLVPQEARLAHHGDLLLLQYTQTEQV